MTAKTEQMPAPFLSDEIDRYSRQLLLREIGGAGQQALKKAKVLLIGAGGLGGPAGLYLGAAGIGALAIADHDAVDLSNLHRQIQFDAQDITKSKAEQLAAKIHQQNPHCEALPIAQKMTADNLDHIIKNYDLVLDGTDDFATRFAVNQACLNHNTPLVSGALGRFDAQLIAFENQAAPNDAEESATPKRKTNGPCYRCFVRDIPSDVQTCAEVGVLGALAGMVGSMMALEAIKILTNTGEPLFGRLFIYDGLTAKARTINLPKDPNCPACA